MSPITCQSRVDYRSVRLAGYRVLVFWVIGAILIGLGLGLSYNFFVKSDNPPTQKPGYRTGVLTLMRMARTDSKNNIKNFGVYYQSSGVGPLSMPMEEKNK